MFFPFPHANITGAVGGQGGASGPSSYLGQVSTRTFIPNNLNTGNKEGMSRTIHIARDDIVDPVLLIPNFKVGTDGVETGLGASMSYTAALEYPLGTIAGVYSAGSVASLDVGVTNALAGVTVPKGSTFATRIWVHSTGGILYLQYGSTSVTHTGDGFEFGATTLDKTAVTTAVSNTVNMLGCAPFGIVAQTKLSSLFLLGDSRVVGLADTRDSSGDIGELARAVGPYYAYMNCGVQGDQASFFVTGSNSALRRSMMKYCSHLVLEPGINDNLAGRTDAQLIADRQTIAGYFSGKKYHTTMPPHSTGAWTLANLSDQTIDGSNNPHRVSANASIVGGVVGFDGYLDVNAAVESATSGKWQADGTSSKYTADGLHETQFANLAIATALGINASTFTR